VGNGDQVFLEPMAVENLAAWAFMKMLQGFPGFHSLAGDRLPASDYNIVPRYRYNPKDDRVDTSPNAKPVARVDHLEFGILGIGQ
jgi:hypothetical protein